MRDEREIRLSRAPAQQIEPVEPKGRTMHLRKPESKHEARLARELIRCFKRQRHLTRQLEQANCALERAERAVRESGLVLDEREALVREAAAQLKAEMG